MSKTRVRLYDSWRSWPAKSILHLSDDELKELSEAQVDFEVLSC